MNIYKNTFIIKENEEYKIVKITPRFEIMNPNFIKEIKKKYNSENRVLTLLSSEPKIGYIRHKITKDIIEEYNYYTDLYFANIKNSKSILLKLTKQGFLNKKIFKFPKEETVLKVNAYCLINDSSLIKVLK